MVVVQFSLVCCCLNGLQSGLIKKHKENYEQTRETWSKTQRNFLGSPEKLGISLERKSLGGPEKFPEFLLGRIFSRSMLKDHRHYDNVGCPLC